jgi:polyphosphate kinase
VFADVSQEAHASWPISIGCSTGRAACAREGRHRISAARGWSQAQRQWIRDYFFRELLPVLTPIGLDPAHPFRACSTRA